MPKPISTTKKLSNMSINMVGRVKTMLPQGIDKEAEIAAHQHLVGVAVTMKTLLADDKYKGSLKISIEKVRSELETINLNSSSKEAQEEARGGLKAIQKIKDEIQNVIKAGEDSAEWLQKNTE